MGYIRFPLMTVSPTFIAGADQNQPEIRTQSIRGQLRFWYRAYLGALETDTQAIYQRESAIFGNTEQASAVSIQVQKVDTEIKSYRPVPHSSQRRFQSKALVPETYFELRYITPPSMRYPTELSHATSLWLLLGGLGRRSRRMMGSVQMEMRPKKKTLELDELSFPTWWRNWEKIQVRPDQLPKLVATALETCFLNQELLGNINLPSFPTLHPRYSRILVGQQSYGTAEEANIAFFNVIRQTTYRAHEDMFGHATGGRHASPVIAQVRLFDGKYYPIITAMRSSTLRGDWEIVDNALNELKDKLECEEVWGEGKLS